MADLTAASLADTFEADAYLHSPFSPEERRLILTALRASIASEAAPRPEDYFRAGRILGESAAQESIRNAALEEAADLVGECRLLLDTDLPTTEMVHDAAAQLQKQIRSLKAGGSSAAQPVAWAIAVEEHGKMVLYGQQYTNPRSAEQDAELLRKRGKKAEVWACYRVLSSYVDRTSRCEVCREILPDAKFRCPKANCPYISTQESK